VPLVVLVRCPVELLVRLLTVRDGRNLIEICNARPRIALLTPAFGSQYAFSTRTYGVLLDRVPARCLETAVAEPSFGLLSIGGGN